MKNNRIRVYILDDHKILREGVKNLLSDSEIIEVVGHSDMVENLFEILTDLEIDVLLLDMFMPKLEGTHISKSITD